MNTEEKIESAGKKKEEGNALFKAGIYAKASKRYEKVKKLWNFECLNVENFNWLACTMPYADVLLKFRL